MNHGCRQALYTLKISGVVIQLCIQQMRLNWRRYWPYVLILFQYLLFEFNDYQSQSQFRNMVNPYLRRIQGRRGIIDYHVECSEVNNPPEVVDSAEFIGDVYIKPARSINVITLNFIATRTGVDFDEVVGSR